MIIQGLSFIDYAKIRPFSEKKIFSWALLLEYAEKLYVMWGKIHKVFLLASQRKSTEDPHRGSQIVKPVYGGRQFPLYVMVVPDANPIIEVSWNSAIFFLYLHAGCGRLGSL